MLVMRSIVTFLVSILLHACASDLAIDLSGGYIYRDEGGDIKDIFNRNGMGEIPATVNAYDYDDDFIIAKQRPKWPGDPLYERQPDYWLGIQYEYYWIIDLKQGTILGPLDEAGYWATRSQLGVPAELVLQ